MRRCVGPAACAESPAMELGPWVCRFVGVDGVVCGGWGMTGEERRCHKCGAPRPFVARELMVGQARHGVRCCRRTRAGGSGHAQRADRWSTESGACHLSVHNARNFKGRKAVRQLRARFGLAVDEDSSYIHVQWQATVVATAAAEQAHRQEFLLRTSAITAQAVCLRPPEQLADGAGSMELTLELDSMPRALAPPSV
jgi:hypothetical protein